MNDRGGFVLAMRRQPRLHFFQAWGGGGEQRVYRVQLRCDLHTHLNRENCTINARYDRYHLRFSSSKIYAIGEGWTGSFGSGRLDQRVAGHNDEEEADCPLLVFETDQSVTSCAVGWGHSAFIHNHQQLFLTGRPHEFLSLLRLARLPNWFRQYAIQQTHRTVHEETASGFQLTDILGRPLAFLSDLFLKDTDWDSARWQSEMVHWTPFHLLPETPVHVSCSAGFTAVTGQSGKLYTFGLNSIGQCGTGEINNNVWVPKPVTGLSRASDDCDVKERIKLEQSHPIVSSSLGLQHGLSLNSAGEVFAWGKGSRGQLGFDRVENESHSAVPVHKAVFDLEQTNQRPIYRNIEAVSQISAGMIHSAALEEESNHVYIWGKHILPPLETAKTARYQKASDAHIPVRLKGLPPERKVLQISCGSHHTSVLLEDGSVWAVGISTDSQQPMFEPVCLIAAGAVDLPVRHFEAHMDRTTVVTGSGQVLQVHLWEDPANQSVAVFTPSWAFALDEREQIQSVHRSWLHTMIVTKEDSKEP